MPTVPRPTTDAGVAGQAAILADPGGAMLALDFDGVLAPIVADPTQSRPQDGVLEALRRLGHHLGSLTIISGRPAAVVVDYAGLGERSDRPDLVVFGHYGLERWDSDSGRVQAPEEHQGVPAVRAALPGLLGELQLDAEVYVEDKGRSVAVHTRRAQQPAATLERLTEPLARLARRHGLAVEPGRMVLELRPPGMDKGRALRRHATDRGARSVAYVGDDLGDLPAFAAIDDLRAEGVPGLKVCSGSSEVSALAEQADLVVDGPAGVVALLRSWADALGEGAGPDGLSPGRPGRP